MIVIVILIERNGVVEWWSGELNMDKQDGRDLIKEGRKAPGAPIRNGEAETENQKTNLTNH